VRGIWATLARELRAFYFSPLAYVVMVFFLIVNGFVFAYIVTALNNPATVAARPLDFFFGGILWPILLILAPVLTMRLVSEERRSGSIETLMTAPVSEAQVVVGKYLAALVYYVSLWVPTLVYALLLAHYATLDWGPVMGGYLGTIGIGALFLAVGIFASAMTKSQLIAAIVTFALVFTLAMLGLLENIFNSDFSHQTFGYMSLFNHMEDFSKGIVDTRRLVYYLSGVVFFLFLTSRALEERKWR
jgi:ABC-2 type transport system permease protein